MKESRKKLCEITYPNECLNNQYKQICAQFGHIQFDGWSQKHPTQTS